MKLGEIQKLYYLLNAIQFNYEETIDFDLIVDYNGKLITADFLKFGNNRKTIVSEKTFDSNLDILNISKESNFFDEVLGVWRRKYEPYSFNPSKAFSEPGAFLDYVMNACNEIDHVPLITNRVYNLRYLESDVNLKEAILMEESYSVVALLPK